MNSSGEFSSTQGGGTGGTGGGLIGLDAAASSMEQNRGSATCQPLLRTSITSQPALHSSDSLAAENTRKKRFATASNISD